MKTLKISFLMLMVAGFLVSCGGSTESTETPTTETTVTEPSTEVPVTETTTTTTVTEPATTTATGGH